MLSKEELQSINDQLINIINEMAYTFYMSTHVSQFKNLHPYLQLLWINGQTIFNERS